MTSTTITRRSVLQAAGVSITLPWLEATRAMSAQKRIATKARMVFVYVPNGVNYGNWLPAETGLNYKLSLALEVLTDHREDFSLLSGLSHPNSKGGHSGADTWLTGADLSGTPGYDYRNSISVDQLAARTLALQTRIPSLQLSSHGGTGKPGHSQTLSFNDLGIPLPAENDPKRVFQALFTNDGLRTIKKRNERIEEDRSILDVVLDQAKSLHRELGRNDQQKLDEYLSAVREVEIRIQRNERWLNVPRPRIESNQIPLHFQPTDADGSQNYYRTMFDLLFLALQTDTTRVCSFQLAREAHGGFVQGLISSADHHELSHHGGDPSMLEGLFTVDKFYLAQLGHFLDRLKTSSEGTDTLLDRTMIFYGSGMNNGKGGGHSGRDLPLLIAGGKGLGLKQGQHLAYNGRTPLSNLFVTMLQQASIGFDQFSDSSGTLTGMV